MKTCLKNTRRWAPASLALALAASFLAFPAGAEPPKTYADSFGIKFALIPAGSFLMGSAPNDDKADDDEKPQRKATISRPFYLGVYEVTQAQWAAAMDGVPSEFKGADYPVEKVSWEDAQIFIRKLNGKAGHNRYRLPTEAEWEYAARAGSASAYAYGDDPAQLSKYAWYKDNSDNKTHAVGLLKPNAFGLYDMCGNVWEWVSDWYGENYYLFGEEADPAGPAVGSYRTIRGGSWLNVAAGGRSANRDSCTPGYRSDNLGFRLALSLE